MTNAVTKKPEGEPAQNRLMGMLVHEVSLVDRAANQRKFLLLKRDPMGAKAKVTKDDAALTPGEGGLTPPGDAPNAPAPGGELTMQAQVKDQILAAITSAAEKCVTVANMIKDATTSEEAQTPPVPESVTSAIGEVAAMLTAIASQYGGAADAGKGATDPAASAPPAGAAPTAETQKREMIAKVGRRMAKERYQRFQKAIDILAGILKELGSDAMKKRAAPVAVGAGQVVLEKALAEGLIEDAEKLAKQAATDATEKATLRARVIELEKKVGTPNSGGDAMPARSTPAAVSWPIDMNRPIVPRAQGRR